MEGYYGQIMMWSCNWVPKNWAFCDGQLLPIAQNTALYSLLGVTYGGNGTTNFALPDLRGRVPLHVSGNDGAGNGLSRHTLGEQGGSESVTLLNSQMPMHNHSLTIVNSAGNQSDPTNNLLAVAGTAVKGYSNVLKPTGTMNAQAIGIAGSNMPVSIMQPYLGVNFIICVQGIYPSRDY
jgi:microcystin-dependent protein